MAAADIVAGFVAEMEAQPDPSTACSASASARASRPPATTPSSTSLCGPPPPLTDIRQRRIEVRIRRRANNPFLPNADYAQMRPAIPWLGGCTLILRFPRAFQTCTFLTGVGIQVRQADDQFAEEPMARLRSLVPSLSMSISAYPTSASGRLMWVNRSYQRGCEASPELEPVALTVIASNRSPSRYVYRPFAARSALRTACIPRAALLSASSSEPNSDAVQISQAGGAMWPLTV